MSAAKIEAAKPRTCDACKLHTDLDLFRVMRLCPRWGKGPPRTGSVRELPAEHGGAIMSGPVIATEERNKRLREWCESEAAAADQRAAEAERMARAWREAADGLRRAAQELETP